MKDITLKLGVLICLALLVPIPAHAAKYAVVIGSGDYIYARTVTPLPKAAKDARDIAAALAKVGWVGVIRSDSPDVITTEVTRRKILAVLSRARQLTEDDEFLLFYAGHGVRDAESQGSTPDYYWLTHTAEIDNLQDRGIRFQEFMEQIYRIPARKKLILLDHCFGGMVVPLQRLGSDQPSRTDGSEQRFTLQRAPESRSTIANPIQGNKLLPNTDSGIVVIAADRDYAFENDTNGIFTSVLLAAFGSNEAAGDDGELTLKELSDYVDERVEKEARDRDLVQDPVINGDTRPLRDWKLALNLPKGNVDAPVFPLSDLLIKCEEWEEDGKILIQHLIRCRRAIDYKRKRIAEPDTFPIDPKKEKLHRKLEDHAMAVQASVEDSEIDEMLLNLCESLQGPLEEDRQRCSN